MQNRTLPTAFEEKTTKETVSRFIVEPLKRGQAQTLGNSLRRIMLSSIEGYAIQAIKIDDMTSEFDEARSTAEDGPQIVAALKKVSIASSKTPETLTGRLCVKGPGVATAGCISFDDPFLCVKNPQQVIASVADGSTLSAEIVVGVGVGFVDAELNRHHCIDDIGWFPIDSNHCPVTRCTMAIENTGGSRHETEDERLVLEVETTGAITPSEALNQAADLLVQLADTCRDSSKSVVQAEDAIAALDIGCLGLSEKVVDSLKNEGVETLGDLVKWTPERLKELPAIGLGKIKKIADQLSFFNLKLA